MGEAIESEADALSSLAASYKPLDGVADELMDAEGAIRPVWRAFARHFAGLSADSRAERFRRGDQYLRDAGVYFRQTVDEGTVQRAWPLSHVPVILHESDWRDLSEGLIQRANLLETLVADLYGDNTLVRDGYLPADLIAANPRWLRPMVGVAPPSGHYLHMIAFEVGRDPNGHWRVLSDRTQAPAGAGIALENRLATSRVYPELFATANVRRLASFFRAFRAQLSELDPAPGELQAILTPGPGEETYLEHAYLARYLGMMLIEGEDLTVSQGQAMIRTVAGLRRIGVIWRLLHDQLLDPLELDETSFLGTPGLLGAVREGSVHMANALGSGVLEARAMMAFLPRIAEFKLNEPLLLPNVATWWCGDRAARAHVRANAERMLVSPALSNRLPFDPADDIAFGAHIRDTLEARLDRDGPGLVGQEIANLSTSPALVDGELQPRPMTIRMFLCRTANGWRVMPGGQARIGKSLDVSAVSIRGGGSVADVWVVSDQPVKAETLASRRAGSFHRPEEGTLPSRAADNLYWLGRYVERAEIMVRLLRAYHLRIAEQGEHEGSLQSFIADYMETLPLDPSDTLPTDLIATLNGAAISASRVHDRFSIDGWTAIRDLSEYAAGLAESLRPGDDTARAMTELLHSIAAFTGLVHENMFRFAGWQFLTIGRSLERTYAMASVLSHFAAEDAPEGAMDVALEVGDCVLTYHRRYSLGSQRDTVIDLMVFDTMNPRSVLFQLSELRSLVARLPGAEEHGLMSPLSRDLLRIYAGLAIETPEALSSAAIAKLAEDVGAVSDQLTAAYLA